MERKDIIFLMEVRDRAFHVPLLVLLLSNLSKYFTIQLLLRKSGDSTPLLHCLRIGQSHRDVAIVLLGAFSRYVNYLTDEEIALPRTKTILKALRMSTYSHPLSYRVQRLSIRYEPETSN